MNPEDVQPEEQRHDPRDDALEDRGDDGEHDGHQQGVDEHVAREDPVQEADQRPQQQWKPSGRGVHQVLEEARGESRHLADHGAAPQRDEHEHDQGEVGAHPEDGDPPEEGRLQHDARGHDDEGGDDRLEVAAHQGAPAAGVGTGIGATVTPSTNTYSSRSKSMIGSISRVERGLVGLGR